jgi:RNA polymerase sigma factor (sigma-70 family)
MTKEFAHHALGAMPMTGLPVDFAAFHQMHRPAYVRWAQAHLRNRADAEEAVDCAFEQLALSWRQVLSMENPAAYAWRVMKNRTIDAARARGRRPALMDTAAFETAALCGAVDPIDQLEENLSLYRAISELPERQQDVVVLRYCLDYTVSEVADHLGISDAGVRSTARHAKRRLQEALGLNEEGRADENAH